MPAQIVTAMKARPIRSLLITLAFIVILILSLLVLLSFVWALQGWLSGRPFEIQQWWEYILKTTNDVSVNIIASLLGTLGSIIYHDFLLAHERAQEEAHLAGTVARAIELKVMSGVRRIRPGLTAERLRDFFLTSNDTVVIETWIEDETLGKYQELLQNLLQERNRKLSFVLLHPNSPSVLRRQRDMRYPGGSGVRNRITACLKALREIRVEAKAIWLKNNPGDVDWEPNLHVHCHDCLPSVQLYKSPQFAFVGFYLQGAASSTGLQLEVEFPSEMGRFLESHVDRLLSDKNKHLVKIDLTKNEEDFLSQFNQEHLECQLDDVADQIVNLGKAKLPAFIRRLEATLGIRDKEGRKERLEDFIVSIAPLVGVSLKKGGKKNK